MRTTLTIDDDLAARIEEHRLSKGLSFKNAIDGLLREGLVHQATPPAANTFRTKTHKLGLRPGFDQTKLNKLADELESEAHRDLRAGSRE